LAQTAAIWDQLPGEGEAGIGSQALQYVDDSFKADREVVLAAVKETGLVLGYADDSLKSDREVVLAAVRQYGYAFQYASEELQQDEELQKIAEEGDG
jgi:hypothetical protein|tara:strand:+ start:3495 stop:3785 length:291 start_codon:yes stop_codon:yes gene_type:complete